MYPITKNIVRMFKYIKIKDGVSAEVLIKNFHLDSDMILITLCKDEFLGCTKPDGKHTFFKDFPENTISTAPEFVYWITPQTKKYLEDSNANIFKWLIPTIIASCSLILSVITFILTIIDKSPILIKILE